MHSLKSANLIGTGLIDCPNEKGRESPTSFLSFFLSIYLSQKGERGKKLGKIPAPDKQSKPGNGHYRLT